MTMTRRGHLTALTAALGLTVTGRALATESRVHGTWTGVLDSVNQLLTLRFVIDEKGIVLNLSSADQGEASFPGSDVVIDAQGFSVSFPRINAKFSGVLSGERHIDGVLTQGQALKVGLTRGEVADTISTKTSPPLTAELLEAQRLAAQAPAIGAAWARGKRSKTLVTGFRSSDSRVRVQASDQWHWGSISKSMTATLCARLVEAGVVRWDITVGEVLDVPGAPVTAAYRNATLLHLLSHRAGLQPNVTDDDAKAYSLHLADARAERLKYVQTALAQKPVGALGAQFAYSNNGYVVAGAMLEKLTGQSWEALIQTQVFTPLDLKGAGQGAPGTRGKIDQPMGHLVTKGVRAPHPLGGPDDDNVAAMGPAGRVHMPLGDMLVYLAAHRDRPTKFLKPATWDKLHTPHFGGNYALGWFTRQDGRLWHGGSNTLWWAEVVVDPKSGAVYATCANDAAPETQKAVAEVSMSTRAAALA